MKSDRRGSWYLLTGAVLGAAIGLIYSWVISPVKFIDAPPSALRADYKDEYRALVAVAYLYSNDLWRAEDRLGQLKDENIAQSLAMQAQRALAGGRPDIEVQALGALALKISQGEIPAHQGVVGPLATQAVEPVVLPPSMLSDTLPAETVDVFPQESPAPVDPIQTITVTVTVQPH